MKKNNKIKYLLMFVVILACFLLASFDIFAGKESIYLSIIMLVDAITYLIATLIYNPDKKERNEK